MMFTSARMKARILAGDAPQWMRNHIRSEYIIACHLSTPPWVDKKALWSLRQKARALTEATGVPHTVDHIVPVTHRYVCGLTVPWNLQVVPHYVNAGKGNKWHPDQHAIDFHPQLTLGL